MDLKLLEHAASFECSEKRGARLRGRRARYSRTHVQECSPHVSTSISCELRHDDKFLLNARSCGACFMFARDDPRIDITLACIVTSSLGWAASQASTSCRVLYRSLLCGHGSVRRKL